MKSYVVKVGAKTLLGVMAIFSCELTWAQGPFQIGFEGPPVIAPTSSRAVTNYSESGMTFTPITPGEFFGRSGGSEVLNGATNFAYNGTAYLFGALGDSLAFRRQSGAAFGLVSVDLAEFSILYQTPLTVQFIGFAPGGSTVTNVFVTDGIIDGGNGPLEDFQTFYFDSQFANVTRVNVPGYGWSMDNLTFIIPEPSVWQLAALASAVLGLHRLLKRPKPVIR